ncbi:hypothetical protein [Halopseudomonas pelagia]|uniref:hypothetical protein n=1 Tax=Halopseudomonas pelagia TaxID=553151 RepID=UPI00039CA2D2|nr:hypothetical protein [Halopseudomonas pelagia]|tara:strand:+ start:342 stop:620 length:279 start_codon:yes stop_codon:yes gene_type:complete
MSNFRILTVAFTLAALSATGTALAGQHANQSAEESGPTHTQGSHSDTDSGGSAQVPGTRDGAEKTNPYDEVGPEDRDDNIGDPMDDAQTINE